MKSLHDFPIQKKILVMTLLICGAVLLVAIAALFVFQVLNFRSNFQRDTSTLAAIVANQSTAAMQFKDEAVAAEVVGSLQAKPSVLSASLALPDGSVLGQFGIKEPRETLAQFPPPGEYRLTEGHLLFSQPVILKHDRIGTLHLRMDYRRMFLELLGFYAQVMAGVIVGSVGLAVFLSSRLGRTITHPVLQLAQTATIVGERKDYSVRASVGKRGDELGQLAESFNEMLSRIESQDAALSLSQQRMEALINAIDGIVWERAPDTLRFLFVSRQSEGILGYPPERWCNEHGFWEAKLHPHDAARAAQSCRDAASQGQPYSFEYRMISADGRTVWIRESGTVLMEKGRSIAMRGIFQDITQAKSDAEQLAKLNQRLLDTSRTAGMADVATGVLHNVGNVLNSVSVSATLVGERLRHSKVTNLRRAAGMLKDQNGRLAEFLTSDPKGKLIPDYLRTATDQLAEEQNELIAEVDAVSEHIEHIKEIVAMQQSYAKVAGVYQDISPAELVEDTLRLNIAAFERHRIELVREFQEGVPAVCVDRHKVMQILINLFRNAKHAMEDLVERERRMVIRVHSPAPGRVAIVVCDNGIGIPAENLTKVFNHGFTTKKDGHGFGLHSGANAAKEMGGSLTARSDGTGCGATFTLELPAFKNRETGSPDSAERK